MSVRCLYDATLRWYESSQPCASICAYIVLTVCVCVRVRRDFSVQDLRAGDAYGGCLSVYPCAGLGDLSCAGLDCALRILIHPCKSVGDVLLVV